MHTIRMATIALALALAAPASAGSLDAAPAGQVHAQVERAQPSRVIVETTRPRESENEVSGTATGPTLDWWSILLSWWRTQLPTLPTL